MEQLQLLEITNPTELAQAITKNPDLIKYVIDNVNSSLDSSKKGLEEIKKRNVFQRLLASNTKDLAEAMLHQSEIMGNFFALLQVLTFGMKRNSALIFEMMECLSEGEKMTSGEQSNLYGMAKVYLQDALVSSQNELIREDALKRLLVNVKALNDTQESNKSTFNNYNSRFTKIEEDITIIRERQTICESKIDSNSGKFDCTDSQLTAINKSILEHKHIIEFLRKKDFWDSHLYKIFITSVAIVAMCLSIYSIIS